MQELRDEEKLCDVALVVQGVEIKAHKIVLAESLNLFTSIITPPSSLDIDISK